MKTRQQRALVNRILDSIYDTVVLECGDRVAQDVVDEIENAAVAAVRLAAQNNKED